MRTEYDTLEIRCLIGCMSLELVIGHAGRRPSGRGDNNGLRGDMPASTPLRLSLTHRFRTTVTTSWEDGGERLERRIGEIATDLIVAGEAAFRDNLIDMREWAEQSARWREEAELAERRRFEQKRIDDLWESGTMLRRAEELRALVARVKAAVSDGTVSGIHRLRRASPPLRRARTVTAVRAGRPRRGPGRATSRDACWRNSGPAETASTACRCLPRPRRGMYQLAGTSRARGNRVGGRRTHRTGYPNHNRIIWA